MTATAAPTPATALEDVSTIGRSAGGPPVEHTAIPTTRLVALELRKMFDTRSGFWLLMSIGILATVATVAVIAFGSADAMNFDTFSSAVGIPMAILLPVVAILAITGEWTQRSGLTTFALVPARGKVIGAKFTATVAVGVVSMLVAMGIGAVGNIVGAGIAGVDVVWGITAASFGQVVLASVLGMLMGFMFGTITRSTIGALVGYFAYAFVLPTITGILMSTQDWYADIVRWVDFQYNTTALYESGFDLADWGYLGFTALIWLVLPLAIGLRIAVRAEVK